MAPAVHITTRNDDKDFSPLVFKEVEFTISQQAERRFNLSGVFFPIVFLGGVINKFFETWWFNLFLNVNERADIVSTEWRSLDSEGKLVSVMMAPKNIGLLIERHKKV